MRLSPRLSLFLTLAWTLILFGGWALLSERTSEAAPLAYDPDLEFKVLGHIPVGDDPRGIAVVGDKVYVANHDADTISIIDADTLTVTQVISANSQPCAMAYNPNNGYLYVTNRVALGTVTIINTDTHTQVVTPLGVGRKPTGIAFNPYDGLMYVPLFEESEIGAENEVVVVGGTVITDRITGFGSGRALSHVAVNADANKVYVTDHNYSDSRVFVIDGSTRTVTDTIFLNLHSPWGIAVNQSTEYVYVAPVSSGDQLGVIKPDDTYTVTEKLVPGAALRMVAVDPIQNLVFVTEDEPDASPTDDPEHVFVFDADAGDWADEPEITVQQDPERGIAFDPVRHRLYVSNRRSDTVTVIQTIRKLYFPIIMKSFSLQ